MYTGKINALFFRLSQYDVTVTVTLVRLQASSGVFRSVIEEKSEILNLRVVGSTPYERKIKVIIDSTTHSQDFFQSVLDSTTTFQLPVSRNRKMKLVFSFVLMTGVM